MPKHRHRAVYTITTPYHGADVNVGLTAMAQKRAQAARGGLTIVSTCRCGATRTTNTCGVWVARGKWVLA